jgi:class II flagellar assembly regulator FliX
MKVTGTGGVGQTGGARGPKAAGGEGFRLPGGSAPAATSQTGGVATTSAVMGVEALLTLQDVGGPLERRRRAVSRAGRLLDVLDEIKLALLDGQLGAADLQRLERAIRDQRTATEDPKLEALLDEIETRAAVELAKLQQANASHVS